MIGAVIVASQRSRLSRLGIALIASIAGSVACGHGPSAPVTQVDPVFIAFGSSFHGFRSWESFARTQTLPGSGCVHTTCARTDYLNLRPRSGNSTFPVGTIIVKVLDDPGGVQ